MNKPPQAWSHSALQSFETCPRKHWFTRAAPKGERIVEPESEHQRWGNYVHSQLEQYAKTRMPPHQTLHALMPIVDKIVHVADQQGQLLVEEQFALDTSFRKTDWFSKTVWFRMKIDLAVIDRPVILLTDYKTGKQKDDEWDQLNLTAAMLMNMNPNIQRAKLAFIWTANMAMTSSEFDRAEVTPTLNDYYKRLVPYQAAFDNMDFPAKPNGLCRRHCPVHTCPHYKKG